MSEDWITELDQQIGRRTLHPHVNVPPPLGVLDVVSLGRECLRWLEDDRVFDRRRITAWNSLVRDFRLALDQLGPELARHLAPSSPNLSGSFAFKVGASAAERTAAAKELEALLRALDTGEASVSAWRDLVVTYQDAAASPEQCDLRETQLEAVARLRGHEWWPLCGELRGALTGQGRGVEQLPDGTVVVRQESAACSLPDRLRACEQIVAKPARSAEQLVAWVALHDVSIWRWVIELDRITFYDSRWWSSVIVEAPGQLPQEVAEASDLARKNWFSRLTELKGGETPFVVARVELGRRPVAGALGEARRIAMALLHTAGLRAGELRGTPYGGGVLFSEGKEIAHGGFALEAEFAEVRKERIDDRSLGRALTALEPDVVVATHQSDTRLSITLAAVEWLKETKGLTPAQQLALSIRAIEQVFSATDMQHWHKTVLERLSYTWALAEIGDIVRHSMYWAIKSLGDPEGRQAIERKRAEFLDVDQYVMGGEAFLLRRAAERISWTRSRLENRPRLSRELRMLELRLASGLAAAAWLAEVEQEFRRNVDRVHRLRNAILHGYPLEQDVVRLSAPFARSISIHAVHALVDAAAQNKSLLTHLDGLKHQHDAARASLSQGVSPVDAFGWAAGR